MRANEGKQHIKQEPRHIEQFSCRGGQPARMLSNIVERTYVPQNGGAVGATSLPWVTVSKGRIK